MAGIIDEKIRKELESMQAAQTPAALAPVAQAPAASSAPAGVALKGVSEATAGKLNQYSTGYQQSAGVQAAQDYLSGVLNSKPVADAQLSQLYDRIMNREAFSYDLNGDALYQQYKDKYQSLGKQAMMDTMGNATALTGGYGSSYATTAGNQAYQQYLQRLNDVVPDLYKTAYDRYLQEGSDLMNRYNLAYGQYRDAMGDWEGERNYANSDYWARYNADYADYQNMLNYWNQMAQQESGAWYTDRDYALSLAKAIIDKKNMPSAELLAAAGLTEADAIGMGAKKKKSGGGGGSSRKSSGSGAGSGSSGTGATAVPAAGNVGEQSWHHFYSGSSTASAGSSTPKVQLNKDAAAKLKKKLGQ